MKYQRYSLPSERPAFVADPESSLLSRGWLLLVILSLPPVIGYIWRCFTFGDWGWGFVGLVISAGFTHAVWHGLLARTTNANANVYDRAEKPVRYWLTLLVWFGVYCMSVGALFFVPNR